MKLLKVYTKEVIRKHFSKMVEEFIKISKNPRISSLT